jgi:hypothetical protein
MCVHKILTLFLQGAELRSKYTLFFITHFSICHSFLDFLYIGVFCGVLYFPLIEKEIEMDFSGVVECSDQVHSNERTNK